MTPAQLLLRRRDYWRLVTVGQLAALPVGMTPLAYTLLTVAALGSYRVGSVLVTVGVLAEVAVAPLAGRLLDRLGIGKGLPMMLLVAAAGYALLAALGTRVPEQVLIVLAVLPALPGAAFSGGVRTAMAQKLPADLLSPAIAMNATLLEITLITGPLLAAGLATLAPTAAIGVLALAMLAAAALFPRTIRRDHTAASTPRVRLLRAGFSRWLVCAFGVGVLFGSLEVGALALAHRLHGGSGTAALLLALLSGCSALAGLAFTLLGHRLRSAPLRRAVVLLTVMGCAMLVIAQAGNQLLVGTAFAAIGVCAAPLLTTQSLGAESALPKAQLAEGFSLLFTAQGAGYALGSLAVALLPLTAAQLTGAAAPLAAAFFLRRPKRTTRKPVARRKLVVKLPINYFPADFTPIPPPPAQSRRMARPCRTHACSHRSPARP